MGKSLLEWTAELSNAKNISEIELQKIADAIRTKDGTTALISPKDFPKRIYDLPQGTAASGTYTETARSIEGYLNHIGTAIRFKETGSFSGVTIEANTFADRILALESKKPSRLPAGYTEVEYIETTSENATLPLTYKAIRSNSKFEGTFGATEKPSATRYLLKCTISTTSYIDLRISSSGMVTGYCGYASNNNYASNKFYSFPNTFTFKIDLTGSLKKVYLNSSSGTAVWSNTSYNNYLTLGKTGSSSKALVGMRVYSMKASCSTYSAGDSNYPYFNWELIPCMTDDGKIGLYDVTNDTSFLASATYWSAGPAV